MVFFDVFSMYLDNVFCLQLQCQVLIISEISFFIGKLKDEPDDIELDGTKIVLDAI